VGQTVFVPPSSSSSNNNTPSIKQDKDLKLPILRIYGATEEGNSVLIYVHGFQPYFYVPCWDGFSNDDLKSMGDSLNVRLTLPPPPRFLFSMVAVDPLLLTSFRFSFFCSLHGRPS
jgi:hypothetical protein